MRIFSETVPYASRGTLHFDLRAAVPTGFYLGIASLLAMFVKKSLHAPNWQVALLVAAPVAGHLFSFYWGYLCHRRRKMPFVLWPGLVSRGLYFGVGLFSDSLVLVILASVAWFIDCISFPPSSAIYNVNYPVTHRYQAVGAVTLIRNVVAAATGFGAGWVLSRSDMNYHWLFPVGALVGIAGVLLFARIKVRGERDLEEPEGDCLSVRMVFTSMGKSMGLLFRDVPFGLYMLAQFVFSWFWLMTDPALICRLDEMGVTYEQASLVLVVVKSVAVALTLLPWSWALQRLGPFRGRVITCSLVIVGLILLAVADSVELIYVAQAIIGVAGAGAGLLWTLAQLHFGAEKDSTLYTGAHATLTGIRGVTAPFACAWLLSFMSPKNIFWLAVVAYAVIVAYLIVLLVYKLDEPRPTQPSVDEPQGR